MIEVTRRSALAILAGGVASTGVAYCGRLLVFG